MFNISQKKMMTSFILFWFVAFFPLQLFASTIPKYLIREVHLDRIVLDNEAVFAVDGIYQFLFPIWQVGDEVEICQGEITFNFSVKIEGSILVHKQLFYLRNVTQGTLMIGYLSSPPELDLVTIQEINLSDKRIALSDGTAWNIEAMGSRFLSIWEIGDAVLLGRNCGFFQQSFDGILFNTNHNNAAKSIQL